MEEKDEKAVTLETDKADENIAKEIGGQFKSLLWNKSLKKLFMDGKTADVEFVIHIGNIRKRVSAHKCVLAAASKTFDEIFFGESKIDGDVDIFNVSYQAFLAFLQFFYAADVFISMKYVEQIMYLAFKFAVNEILVVCDTFLSQYLNNNNILFGYDLAIKYKRCDLEEELMMKISQQEEFNMEEFSKCSREVLISFLNIGHMVCGPMNIFKGCVLWAANECLKKKLDPLEVVNVKNELGACFNKIPFNKMSGKEISEIAVQYKGLFDQDELVDLILIAASSNPTGLKKFKVSQ